MSEDVGAHTQHLEAELKGAIKGALQDCLARVLSAHVQANVEAGVPAEFPSELTRILWSRDAVKVWSIFQVQAGVGQGQQGQAHAQSLQRFEVAG